MRTVRDCCLLGFLATAFSVGAADCLGQVVRKNITAGGAIILPDPPVLTAEQEREARLRKEIEKFQAEQQERLRAAAALEQRERLRALDALAPAPAVAERLVMPARMFTISAANGVRVEFVTVPKPASVTVGEELDVIDENPAAGNSMDVAISENSLDSLLFGATLNATSVRLQLEQRLAQRIGAVDGICKLTPEQKRTLELAGRGDTQRYFERAEAMRSALRQVRVDMADRGQLITRAVAAIESAQASRDALNSGGLFGDSSLFAKAMRKVLTADQAADHDLRQLRTLPETRPRTLERNPLFKE